ncbi:MAG: AAA family ATPase [Betaproteobacteria bacterium]|nr:AAA family ATPase [Betaproteobacteria bacterium]
MMTIGNHTRALGQDARFLHDLSLWRTVQCAIAPRELRDFTRHIPSHPLATMNSLLQGVHHGASSSFTPFPSLHRSHPPGPPLAPAPPRPAQHPPQFHRPRQLQRRHAGGSPGFRRMHQQQRHRTQPRSHRTACDGLVPEASVQRIAAAEQLALAVVARAAAVVRAIQDKLPAERLTPAVELLIGNTLQAQGHARLKRSDANRLPEVYDPAFLHTDTDIAGMAEGIARTRSARMCLYGPPGTGKTAFGRWLAERLGMRLTVRKASDLVSMWLGETEKNIARAFRDAEQDGALLLIDEVESFLQDRRGAQRSWDVAEVNEMLTQMESFGGVFIASTNLMGSTDRFHLRPGRVP